VDELARWLADFEVNRVVMESTGVYWKPVYYGLEGLFDQLWLVNAHHVKNVPGRKTDMADAEWLADVAAPWHGAPEPGAGAGCSGAARADSLPQGPSDHTRPGRSSAWTRFSRRRHQDLLGRLDGCSASRPGPWSKRSSRANGTPPCWPIRPCARCAPKSPALTEALAGRFGAHHAVVARAILGHIDFLDSNIAVLDEEVAARLAPFRPAVELLKPSLVSAETAAQVFVAETGGDMSRFPSAEQPGGVGRPRPRQ